MLSKPNKKLTHNEMTENFTEMTSNMIYIVAFGVGLKCPRKIH